MLYILTPLVENDVEVFFKNANHLVEELKSESVAFRFFVCFQGEEKDFKRLVYALSASPFLNMINLLYLTEKGVSLARNTMLDVVDKYVCSPIDRIYFYDANIVLPIGYGKILARIISSDSDAVFHRLKFVDLNNKKKNIVPIAINFKKTVSFSSINLLKHCSLSKWFFRRGLLTGLRFDVNWGPGDRTIYKSAEDVLFLSKINKSAQCVYINNISVFRQTRPKNLAKHALYAEGHGAILKILFKKQRAFYLLSMILFILNTFRIGMLGRTGREVAFSRIKGLKPNIFQRKNNMNSNKGKFLR